MRLFTTALLVFLVSCGTVVSTPLPATLTPTAVPAPDWYVVYTTACENPCSALPHFCSSWRVHPWGIEHERTAEQIERCIETGVF